MIDGQIDYSQFSREDLIDSIRHVDVRRFPLNHANAVSELGKRPVPKADSTIVTDTEVLTRSSTDRRPMAVWIIFWFTIPCVVVLVPSYFAVRGGLLQLSATPALQSIVDRYNLVDDLSVVAIAALNLFAAFSLLRLRRSAFYLFATAFACNILATLYVASRGLLNPNYVSTLVGLVGAFLVVTYTRTLLNRGVLR